MQSLISQSPPNLAVNGTLRDKAAQRRILLCGLPLGRSQFLQTGNPVGRMYIAFAGVFSGRESEDRSVNASGVLCGDAQRYTRRLLQCAHDSEKILRAGVTDERLQARRLRYSGLQGGEEVAHQGQCAPSSPALLPEGRRECMAMRPLIAKRRHPQTRDRECSMFRPQTTSPS